MEFAVWHEGLKEGTGRWVLHVDAQGERLLLSSDAGATYWQPIADCRVLRAASPDVPRLVLPVQPQQPQIVTPNFGARN